jgi:hypothetical protein
MRISRSLHDHTRKLEVAVEGTYVGQAGDDRVRLLSDSLRISRTAELELARLNQTVQRVIASLQEELDLVSTSSPTGNFERVDIRDTALFHWLVSTSSPTGNFEREREALNTSIFNLQRQRNELETLYEIARVPNSKLEFNQVLLSVMDEVIDLVKAERGFLVLLNPVTHAREFKIARDKQQRTIDQGEFAYQISRSAVERVVRTREPVLTDDAQVDDALKAQESIMAYGIRSIMCVPLMVRDTCIGAVYVDSRINANLFSDKHRDLLLAFCHQAGIAIDNARLFADALPADQQAFSGELSKLGDGGGISQPIVAGSQSSVSPSGSPIESAGETHLSLFAVAQAELEEADIALIGKTYSLYTGISQFKPESKAEPIQAGPIQIKPEAFAEEPFDLAVSSIDKPVLLDILLHTSKNIKLITHWQMQLQYNPRDPEPQLVEFTFRVVVSEQSFLVIDFYHERRWLRTMRLEFNAVEESQLTAVSSGDR